MSMAMTSAPCSAINTAWARPCPRAAPVMNATLPSRRLLIVLRWISGVVFERFPSLMRAGVPGGWTVVGCFGEVRAWPPAVEVRAGLAVEPHEAVGIEYGAVAEQVWLGGRVAPSSTGRRRRSYYSWRIARIVA